MGETAEYYRVGYRLHRDEPVPAAEVDRLALEARAGNRGALRELGVRLAGLAEALASERVAVGKGRGLAADDLRQEAMAAMLGALARWDPDVAAFRTYAYSLARFAVLNALNEGHLVKVPRHLAGYVAKGDEANLERYAPATREAARAASSAPWELLPTLDEEPVEPPREHESLAKADAERALRGARPPLTPRERRVVFALYGLEDGIARKLAAVARDEGISRTWAYALRDSALKKMRAARGAEKEAG